MTIFVDDTQGGADDNKGRLKGAKKGHKERGKGKKPKAADKIALDNKDKLRGLDDDVGVSRKEILKVEALMVKSINLSNERQASAIELASS